MSQFRALILAAPGAYGVNELVTAFQSVDFDPEVLDVTEMSSFKIEQEQLCLKYKVLVLPGGNTYGSVLGSGRALALKIEHELGWNLSKFAERGGLILGIGTGFQTLLHLGVFGKEYALKMNEAGVQKEIYLKTIPCGSRSVWLKGLGTLELPINQLDTEFIIDQASFVEANGKLERLGLACLKDINQEKIMGLCDMTGLILGLIPHPEFALSWTQSEDWSFNPTRASAPGQGMSLFENVAKYCIEN